MRLPTLVPTTRSTGIRSCSSTRMTPTWAKPRAAPPDRTRATFGSGIGAEGGGATGGGAATGTVTGTVTQDEARRASAATRRMTGAFFTRPRVIRIAPGEKPAGVEISRKIDRLTPISDRRPTHAPGHRVDGARAGPRGGGGHRAEREPEAHERAPAPRLLHRPEPRRDPPARARRRLGSDPGGDDREAEGAGRPRARSPRTREGARGVLRLARRGLPPPPHRDEPRAREPRAPAPLVLRPPAPDPAERRAVVLHRAHAPAAEGAAAGAGPSAPGRRRPVADPVAGARRAAALPRGRRDGDGLAPVARRPAREGDGGARGGVGRRSRRGRGRDRDPGRHAGLERDPDH